jgi:hypothetical protein
MYSSNKKATQRKIHLGKTNYISTFITQDGYWIDSQYEKVPFIYYFVEFETIAVAGK